MLIKKELLRTLLIYSLGLAFLIPIGASFSIMIRDIFPNVIRCETVEGMRYNNGITFYKIEKTFCDKGLEPAIPEMFRTSLEYSLFGLIFILLLLLGIIIFDLLNKGFDNNKETYKVLGVIFFVVFLSSIISYAMLNLASYLFLN